MTPTPDRDAHGEEARETAAVRLGSSIFPLLPDIEDNGAVMADGMITPVEPHPDGRSWLKACGECALRRHDPQEIGNKYQEWIAKGEDGRLFYCLHRDDQGKHRVCACYAALHPEQATARALLDKMEGR